MLMKEMSDQDRMPKAALFSSVLLIFCAVTFLGTFHTQAQSRGRLIKQAYIDYENGQYHGAIEYLNLARAKGSRRPYIHYLKGVCFSMLTEYDSAILSFKQALKRKRHYPEVHFEMGLTYFSMGKNHYALKAFDESIFQDLDNAAAYFNRGTVRCAINDRQGAKRDWEKAAELGMQVPVVQCD